MWSSIIMQENNFVMPGVVVGAFLSARLNLINSVESPSNGFVRFEQLIIHDTKLISPNTQHEFFSMNIGLAVDVEAWLGDPHDFFFFELSDPFHYQSVTIRCKKSFRLSLASSISHVKNWRSTFLGFSSYGIQFPCF